MVKATIQLGFDTMECAGETPSEVFLQTERIQDYGCLIMQAQFHGYKDAAESIEKDYVIPAKRGELTYEALEKLNIDFGIGEIKCLEIHEE